MAGILRIYFKTIILYILYIGRIRKTTRLILVSLTLVVVCLQYIEYGHIFPKFDVNIDIYDPLHTNLSAVIPEKFDLNCNCPSRTYLLQYLSSSINASCEQLFKGDKQERQQIRNILKSWKPPKNAETIELMKHCQHIRTEFMDNFYISETERNFPLAFQMPIYYQQNFLLQHIRLLKYLYIRTEFMDNFYISETERNFPLAFQMPIYYQQNFLLQHIRLLKYLYRPHNIYCIHIDKKSPKWWTDGLRQFTKCFNNIFISTKQVHIVYGSVSILDAHLSCLKDLVNVTADWRYVITLNSPEIPLVTNKEMVDTLIKMNGTNIMTVYDDVFTKKTIGYKWLWHKQIVDKQYRTKYKGSRLGGIA